MSTPMIGHLSRQSPSGFVVVFAESDTARFLKSDSLQARRKLPYHGFLRSPWRRIGDVAFGDLHFPDSARSVALEFFRGDTSGLGLCVVESPSAARELYRKVVGGIGIGEEIIAVGSEAISSAFSNSATEIDCELSFRGYDIWVPGEWSLIQDGYCLFPKEFESVSGSMNDANLLADPKDLGRCVDLYDRLQAAGLTEPYRSDWKKFVEPVLVWSMSGDPRGG